MVHHRPRVVLDVSTRLLRDALSRALADHADIVIPPEGEDDHAAWIAQQGTFDLAVVSSTSRAVDLDAGVVVEVHPPDGSPLLARAHGVTAQTITSLTELLHLIPAASGR